MSAFQFFQGGNSTFMKPFHKNQIFICSLATRCYFLLIRHKISIRKNSLRKRIQGKYSFQMEDRKWLQVNFISWIAIVSWFAKSHSPTHQHGQVRRKEKKHAFTLLPNEHLNLIGALESGGWSGGSVADCLGRRTWNREIPGSSPSLATSWICSR